MVFSVGEAEGKALYQRALAQAWTQIQERLQELRAVSPKRQLRLTAVHCDPLSGQSTIEELPDQPKSSRPQAVEVSVSLRATYEVQ